MDEIIRLIDRWLAGENVAWLLSELEQLGPAKSAVFGFILAHRWYRQRGDNLPGAERDLELLCSRAGITCDYRLLDRPE